MWVVRYDRWLCDPQNSCLPWILFYNLGEVFFPLLLPLGYLVTDKTVIDDTDLGDRLKQYFYLLWDVSNPIS